MPIAGFSLCCPWESELPKSNQAVRLDDRRREGRPDISVRRGESGIMHERQGRTVRHDEKERGRKRDGLSNLLLYEEASADRR